MAFRAGGATGRRAVQGRVRRGRSDAKTWIALRAEYKVFTEEKFRAALRAGYSTRAGDARNDKTFPLSFGLGIGMNAFGLDYAFVPYGDLGSTSHITLGYRWGGK